MRVLGLLGAAVLLLGACGGGTDKPAVLLDGSPRTPAVEGVVVGASRAGITLNRGRHYSVSPHLIVFSTYNRKPVTLDATINDYVQMGLDGNEVQWVGLIGVVVTDADGHRTATYQGELVRAAGRRLEFRDGTVLRLGQGLTVPADPLGSVIAYLDVDKGVVEGATFASQTTTTRPTNS